MIIAALVLAGLAALLHVYIFWLESFAWTAPRGRATFGTSQAEAEATKELAYNQGFYNLFLAVVTVVGIALVAGDRDDAGVALVVAGTGSMVAAGLVLLQSSPAKARAALTQLTLPALALLALLVAALV
ncbi:hypothetical protein ASD11_15570 [Aeromicrobium sp. Root495]|uniref:DUF1304 domain-containing protein n=1 Tax=Aeromicrobium sp. Root495 TaxID=1736550 RepID=UPI0006F2C4B5|nr:DUF1304 domain-containing protein [Aeromicrobium sp. Root495]KQY55910.1 hypothetical protein ASD11_15570 [Aeromicrobium sp. Root495]